MVHINRAHFILISKLIKLSKNLILLLSKSKLKKSVKLLLATNLIYYKLIKNILILFLSLISVSN